MKGFILASLPWILLSIAIAVFVVECVRWGNRKIKAKRNENSEEEYYNQPAGNRMSAGMCLGLALGIMLGSAGVVDAEIGVSLFMLLGMLIGMCIKK